MKDICVMCGTETEYESAAPIETRVGYIEGAGQLCTLCNRKYSIRNEIDEKQKKLEGLNAHA